jgi:hypothetical protein
MKDTKGTKDTKDTKDTKGTKDIVHEGWGTSNRRHGFRVRDRNEAHVAGDTNTFVNE